MVENPASLVTVAILAQGTSWAVAVTQAFLRAGSIPGICKERFQDDIPNAFLTVSNKVQELNE